MVSLKTAMGFLELAAAAKFISNADLVWGWNVFSRGVVLAIWLVVGVLLALYLVGMLRVGPANEGARVGWPRRIVAAAVLMLSVRLATGLGGRRLGELDAFLPPVAGRAGQGTADGELPWLTNDYETGLARALR